MIFKQLQLRTSLLIVVLLLSVLTLAAVAVGWLGQQDILAQLSSAGSVNPTVAKTIANTQYVFIGLAVFAIVLALWAYITLSRTVLRPLREVGDVFDHMASGDLTQRIDVSADNEIGSIYVALKRLQDSLGRIVGTARHGMNQISLGSQHILAGNTDLSSRTEQQAAALQQTAASMEELASTVKQNADNARQANQLAASASDVAQRGGQAVGEVVTTMQAISASSRKISDIVGVIDSIAFQTNILALNAAVEAARAGEQGKGFAVVASEVRALAQRSAQAAKEIKGLIEDSVKKVTEGSTQVERAGSTMQEIVSSVARVTDIMGEISAATTEQASGIDQINHAVNQMDRVTQQNAILVEEAASSASGLGEQVSNVSGALSVFKILENQVIDVAATQIRSTPQRATMSHSATGQRPNAKSAAPGSGAGSRPAALGLGNGSTKSKPAQDPGRSTPVQKPQAAPRAAATNANGDSIDAIKVNPAANASMRKQATDDEWVEF
ncbi:methyl-accepting chemotaxis protein [Pollutimonas nitritireducens]|uniref:Methyl-accepting chemotaxis protein n=1 Tax=Pollutimonas nitritireducens TaxID=2045209 RepID=A0A2N4UB45_9BURK|nr:methyl-accepting chemotaxis protein [Pollutimonas nitritireducens]PLC52227.1 methyl-accepting chemotaxis protein [Pollutimonas nitritireducens]